MRIRKGVCGALIGTLLTSTACGNLAVPPPFEEARGGWDVEKGNRVEIVMKDGRRMVGIIEEVAPAGFRVAGEWVPREDIASMEVVWDRSRAAWKVVAVAAVVGVVFVVIHQVTHDNNRKAGQTAEPYRPL